MYYFIIPQVLSEAYRVLQPGGRFLCLEFSQVNNEILQWYLSILFYYCNALVNNLRISIHY